MMNIYIKPEVHEKLRKIAQLIRRSLSDTVRVLIEDEYQKIFAANMAIATSSTPLPTPDEVAAELSMRNGFPFLPAASGMAMRLKECWPRLTEEQREYYRTMCGWSKENVETFFGL